MNVSAKICGLSEPATLDAAIAGGASHVGFVFFPPPRATSRAMQPPVWQRRCPTVSPA